MRLLLAIRVFFKILSDSALAAVMQKHFGGKAAAALPAPEAPPTPKMPPAAAPKAPQRSDAITLLATLQR
jgi:hypothetical protein